MYYFQDLSESSVIRDGADDVIYAGILTTFQLTARSTTGKRVCENETMTLKNVMMVGSASKLDTCSTISNFNQCTIPLTHAYRCRTEERVLLLQPAL